MLRLSWRGQRLWKRFTSSAHYRWTRPNADLYRRPDARNYVRCDPNLYLPAQPYEHKTAALRYPPVWNPDARRWPNSNDGRSAAAIDAELAEIGGQLAVIRYEQLLQKALHPHNYNPDQPRVPAGNPDGGQWTRIAATMSTMRILQRLSGWLDTQQ
jgi:hypothetical protein